MSVREDHILVEAPHPGLQCTPLSIGTFFLHENETPLYHTEPSGVLDLSQLQFEAVDDRTVKVTGARFVPSEKYTVRLEGVEFVGYRSICVSTTRDPVLVGCIDSYLDSVGEIVRQRVDGLGISQDDYKMVYRVMGKDSVMGSREPVKELSTHELGSLSRRLPPPRTWPTKSWASPGRQPRTGTITGSCATRDVSPSPTPPSDIPVGPVYQFNMLHTVEPDSPLEMFPIEYVNV